MKQSALNQLKALTTIVADSSDLTAIEKFRPLDATTNPSLITAAALQPENKEYQPIIVTDGDLHIAGKLVAVLNIVK